jgi:hypothetical protein
VTGIRRKRRSSSIAKVRQRIRDAAESTRACRVLLSAGLPLGLWIAFARELDPVLAGELLLAGLLVGIPLGLAGGTLYRHQRRTRLRLALQRLTGEQLAAVFRGLKVERGDTAKLAAALRRDLRLPNELSPANPPAGRGDEPMPSRD